MLDELNLKTGKRTVELHELGKMLRTVHLENSFIKTDEEYANAVSETFDVLCTKEDVAGYNELHNLHQVFTTEDYELESRRHESGYFF